MTTAAPQKGKGKDEGKQLALLGVVERPLNYVGFDQLVDNRFQPDDQERMADVADLADSIFDHGLQVPIACRVDPDGRGYEIVHGHRRKGAISLLQGDGRLQTMMGDGRWPEHGGVPFTLLDINDSELFFISQTENQDRRPVTPLANVAAWQKALDTVDGLTIEQVAQSVHLDRSTVSIYLSLLGLPDEVRAVIRPDGLSLRGARELRLIETADQRHDALMVKTVKHIEAEGFDWTRGTVRKWLRHFVQDSGDFRPLAPGANDKAGYATSNREAPLTKFDTEAFAKKHKEKVFSIPVSDEVDANRAWTDNVKAWTTAQNAAKPKPPANKPVAGATATSTPTPTKRETPDQKKARLATEAQEAQAATERQEQADQENEAAAQQATNTAEKAAQEVVAALGRLAQTVSEDDAFDNEIFEHKAFDMVPVLAKEGPVALRFLAVGLLAGQVFELKHPDDDSTGGYTVEPAMMEDIRQLLGQKKRPSDYSSLNASKAIDTVMGMDSGNLGVLIPRLAIMLSRRMAVEHFRQMAKEAGIELPTEEDRKKKRLEELKAKATK